MAGTNFTARLGLGLCAAVSGVAGAVMLLRALWLSLAVAIDPISATALVGAGLVVIAAFLALIARPSAPQETVSPTQTAADANPWATLAGAFVEGMRAGRGHGVPR